MYSPGNATQYSIMAYMEKNLKKSGDYIYIFIYILYICIYKTNLYIYFLYIYIYKTNLLCKGVRQGCILSPCLFNFYAE